MIAGQPATPTKAPEFAKYIFDNVHGYIGVTKAELAVINHPLFQRLHNVKQLGPAHLVYPGATHTRFSHSLGSMFVMSEFAKNIRDAHTGELVIRDGTEVQKLRIAALLHDVGHFPFSHVIEEAIAEETPSLRHEELGRQFVTKSSLAAVLTQNEVDPVEIVNIQQGLTKDPPYARYLYKFVLDSDLDVDKVDYLLRDAYHTGVAYGFVDAPRIMRSMTYDEEWGVVFEKATQALENLLLARYHMQQTVYFHRVVTGFELMLMEIYRRLEQQAHPTPNAAAIQKLTEAEFVHYDDIELVSRMRTGCRNDPFLEDLLRMYLKRYPFGVALETPSLMLKDEPTRSRDEFIVDTLILNDAQRELVAAEAGVGPEWVIHYIPPTKSLLKDEEGGKLAIKVRRGKEVRALVEDPASIVSKLQRYRFAEPRIYTKKEYEEPVRRALAKVFPPPP